MPRYAAFVLTLLIAASHAKDLPPGQHPNTPTLPALREELLKMRDEDQQVRQATTQEDFRKWRDTDAANQKRLREIVQQHGWPTVGMVGNDGASAAWLLVQHADSDPDFQQQVLRLMEPLTKQGEASATDYAYLYDRTHYPQRFGTQGSCINAREWQPFAIEDIEHVNQRRHELGLMPMAEYAKHFQCDAPFIAFHDPDDPHKTVPVPPTQ